MIFAAAADPTWYDFVKSVVGSLVGGILALSGVWFTQRAARKREMERWDLELAKQEDDRRLQLYIDAAEHLENEREWLQGVDETFARARATLSVHRTQITARMRLFGQPVANAVWDDFTHQLDIVQDNINCGNFNLDMGTGHEVLDDSNCVPRAQVAADIAVASLRTLLRRGRAEDFTFQVIRDRVSKQLFLKYEGDPKRLHWIRRWLDLTTGHSPSHEFGDAQLGYHLFQQRSIHISTGPIEQAFTKREAALKAKYKKKEQR